MTAEPTYPRDAAVGDPDAVIEVPAVLGAAGDGKAGRPSRTFVTGAAVGVGSAALVAALLYARNTRRNDREPPRKPDPDRT